MAIYDKRIFFGHQSVGNNILEGIRALPEMLQSLPIIESRTLSDKQGPGLFHTAIGRNQDPMSKIQDFVSLMESGLANRIDLAGFKFCYIDIDRNTDIDKLFSEYESAMNTMISRFNNTKFFHMTVPLRTVEPRSRLWIKQILGKKSILLEDNWNRQRFNEKIRAAYHQSLFDLAKAESTYQSGKQLSYSMNGILVDTLIPEYTHDGGHLNEVGRQIVAQQFVDRLHQIN